MALAALNGGFAWVASSQSPSDAGEQASQSQLAAEDVRFAELGRALDHPDDALRAAARSAIVELLDALEQQLDSTEDARSAAWYAYFVAALEDRAATDAEIDPARVDRLARAQRAAARAANFGLQAHCAYQRAELLRTQGRIAEAADALEPVLADLGRAGVEGPSCALLASILAARLGRFERALELTGSAIASASSVLEGDASLQLRATAHFKASDAYLRLGLSDRAATERAHGRALADALSDAQARRSARLQALYSECNADLQAQQHDVLEARARAALADPELALEPGTRRRAEVELRLAIALADLEHSNAARASEARGLLTAIVAAGRLDALQLLRARLWLFELDLREGRADDASARIEEIDRALAAIDAGGAGGTFDERAHFAGLRVRWMHGHVAASPAGTDERAALLAGARSLSRSALDDLYATWRELPELPGGVGFLGMRSRRMLLDESMQIELGLGDARAAWELLHRAQALGTHARERGYEPLSLDEVQRLLCRDGSGLLVYLPSDVRTHVFLIDAAGIAHVALGARPGWGRERERFVELLREGAFDRPPAVHPLLRETAAEVAAFLLPDAVRTRVRRWRQATIVGADALGYVPFEYLALEGGRWLHDELELAYLPSVPLGCFLALRAARPAAPDARDYELVVASGARAPRFAFGAQERERLTRGFDARRVAVLEGTDARLSLIEPRCSAGDRIWHVVAHGTFLESELRPGLVLEDGVLGAQHVAGWDGAPELALLSVCRAGQGRERVGEDLPADLAGAFLRAGSRAVILPREAVEYRAQLALSASLLRHLRDGETPAHALALARRELASEEKYAHPFHGLVHVVGLGDRPVFER